MQMGVRMEVGTNQEECGTLGKMCRSQDLENVDSGRLYET